MTSTSAVKTWNFQLSHLKYPPLKMPCWSKANMKTTTAKDTTKTTYMAKVIVITTLDNSPYDDDCLHWYSNYQHYNGYNH